MRRAISYEELILRRYLPAFGHRSDLGSVITGAVIYYGVYKAQTAMEASTLRPSPFEAPSCLAHLTPFAGDEWKNDPRNKSRQ